ncbi:MAG: hypothetical protein QOA12_08140 [Nitrososphaeraceae archaeon]|nr:hypothetical protein [Nitrososphaeraceae archaeon]MDW0184812.1 hypothetical protein [Nitrososphaeraceae archaeon]MDW0211915.1 hypothetical protein [Nitrososphaeraceae archaeon]MDW0232985.1 hypothetical protein [Nitrososphaeraceae archaeon]MDW0241221.1 hypothetical protein [Nitrososphaeraceae archaeon]
MTKWTCHICGQVVQKFSLVVSHVEKHKQDEQNQIVYWIGYMKNGGVKISK